MIKDRISAALQKLAGEDVPLKFERVTSESITEIGYDTATNTLGVVYNNGFVYTATGFPKSEFNKLRCSDFDRAFPKIVLAKFHLKRKARLAPLC